MSARRCPQGGDNVLLTGPGSGIKETDLWTLLHALLATGALRRLQRLGLPDGGNSSLPDGRSIAALERRHQQGSGLSARLRARWAGSQTGAAEEP